MKTSFKLPQGPGRQDGNRAFSDGLSKAECSMSARASIVVGRGVCVCTRVCVHVCVLGESSGWGQGDPEIWPGPCYFWLSRVSLC